MAATLLQQMEYMMRYWNATPPAQAEGEDTLTPVCGSSRSESAWVDRGLNAAGSPAGVAPAPRLSGGLGGAKGISSSKANAAKRVGPEDVRHTSQRLPPLMRDKPKPMAPARRRGRESGSASIRTDPRTEGSPSDPMGHSVAGMGHSVTSAAGSACESSDFAHTRTIIALMAASGMFGSTSFTERNSVRAAARAAAAEVGELDPSSMTGVGAPRSGEEHDGCGHAVGGTTGSSSSAMPLSGAGELVPLASSEPASGPPSSPRQRRRQQHFKFVNRSYRDWFQRHSQRYTKDAVESMEDFVRRLRDDVAHIEMSRAVLRLYTSNAGPYKPLLQRVFSFLFEYIDYRMDGFVDFARQNGGNICFNGRSRGNWGGELWPHAMGGEAEAGGNGSAESGQTLAVGSSAAFDSVRRLEKQIAEMSSAATSQKEHFTEKLNAANQRVEQLEKLLAHQVTLTHRIGNGDEVGVKQLVARAEREKVLDEADKQVNAANVTARDLAKQVQSLKELNTLYAKQALELVARLQALQEHNIRYATQAHVVTLDMMALRKTISAQQEQIAMLQRENYFLTQLSNREHQPPLSKTGSHAKHAPTMRTDSGPLSSTGNSRPNPGAAPLPSSLQNGSTVSPATCSHVGEPNVPSILEACGASGPCASGELAYYEPLGNTQWVPLQLRTTQRVKRLVLPVAIARCLLHDLSTDRQRQRRLAKGYGRDVPPYNVFLIDCMTMRLKECLKDDDTVVLQYCYAMNDASLRYSADLGLRIFGLVSRQQLSEELLDVVACDTKLFLDLCAIIGSRQHTREGGSPAVPKTGEGECAAGQLSTSSASLSTVHTADGTTHVSIIHLAQILSAMFPGYSTAQIQRLLDAARETTGAGGCTIHFTLLFPDVSHYDLYLVGPSGNGEAADVAKSAVTLTGGTKASSVSGGAAKEPTIPEDTPFSRLFTQFIVEDALSALNSVEEALARFAARCPCTTLGQVCNIGFQTLDLDDQAAWLPFLKKALACFAPFLSNRETALVKSSGALRMKEVESVISEELGSAVLRSPAHGPLALGPFSSVTSSKIVDIPTKNSSDAQTVQDSIPSPSTPRMVGGVEGLTPRAATRDVVDFLRANVVLRRAVRPLSRRQDEEITAALLHAADYTRSREAVFFDKAPDNMPTTAQFTLASEWTGPSPSPQATEKNWATAWYTEAALRTGLGDAAAPGQPTAPRDPGEEEPQPHTKPELFCYSPYHIVPLRKLLGLWDKRTWREPLMKVDVLGALRQSDPQRYDAWGKRALGLRCSEKVTFPDNAFPQ